MSAVKERHVKLNNQREIPYLQAAIFCLLYKCTNEDFFDNFLKISNTSGDFPKVVQRSDNRFQLFPQISNDN